MGSGSSGSASGGQGGGSGSNVLYPTASGNTGSETYTISLNGLTWTSSANGKTWTLTYYTPLDTSSMSKVNGTTVTNSITLTASDDYKSTYGTISGSGSATYTPSITAPTITKSCNGKDATASASASGNAAAEGDTVSVVDWTIVVSGVDSSFTSLTLTEDPQSCTDWSNYTSGSPATSSQTITGITVTVGGNTWTFNLSTASGGGNSVTGTLTESSTDYNSSTEPPSGGTGTITYTPPTENSSSGTLTFSEDWLTAYITADNPAENIITITVTTEIDDAWAGYTYYNYATVDYGFAAEDEGEPDTGSRSANATYRESESKGVTKTGTQTGTNRIHYQVDVDLQDIMEVDADGKADNVGESYTFIFTDELPAGLTLDESTLDASFCGNGYYPTCDHVGTTTFWASGGEKKVTLEITADASGSDASGEYNTIIFTVTISGDVKDYMEANGAASEWSPTAALTLSYDVIITDEDALNKANTETNRTTEVQYTNTVSVSYYTDDADSQTSVGDKAVDSKLYTVTDNRVTKCIANTDPDASLIEGADYSIYTAPYARYTVTLNPDGLKLCEGEDTTYTATDELGSYLEFVDVSDESSSLSEHQKEELCPVFTVDGEEYDGITYEYDQSKNEVVFKGIPDGTAVTITYWVKVLVTDYTTPLSDFNVGNTFSISGSDGGASDSYDISSDYTYALEAESSAWSATRSIKLYKFWVDETGATKSLAGSTFEVYSATYANGVITKSETPYVSGITVGEDGVATISGLYDNVLYVLYEVSSDTGYARRSDPYYFVVGDTDINSENWPTGTHLWTDNENHDSWDYDYENVKAGALTLIKEIKSSEPLSGNLRELAENIDFAVYITTDSTSTGSNDSGSGSGSGGGSGGDESSWSESGSAPNYGEDGILVGKYNVAADFTYGGVTITDADGNTVSDASGSTGGTTTGDTGDSNSYTYTYTFTKTLSDLVPGTYKVVETAGGSEVYEIKSVTYTYTVPSTDESDTSTGAGPDDAEPSDDQNDEPISCTADKITVNEATSEYPLGTEVTFANTYSAVEEVTVDGSEVSLGELVITKTISGDTVSKEELEGALQFTVTRTSGTGTDAANGKDEWTFTLADFNKGTETTNSDGTVTTTYTLTIKDVPGENTYTVRETLYDVKGYSCEVTYAISGQSNDDGSTGQSGDDNNTYGRITQDINGQYAVANIVSGATTNVDITDKYTESQTAGVLKITKTIGGTGTAVTEEELNGALTFTVTNRATNTAETYTLADFTKVKDKNGNAIYDEYGNKNSGIDESAAGVYELELPEEPGGYRVEETLYDLGGYACTVSYTTKTETVDSNGDTTTTRENNNWGSSAPTVVIDSADTTATVAIMDDYVENGTLVIQKTIKGPVTYDEYKGALQFTVTNNDTKESDTYTIEKDFRRIQEGTDGESVTYVKTLDLTPGGYTVEETVWQLDNYVGSVSYVVDGESKGSQNASVKVESKSENTDGTTVAITDEYAVETFASELNKGTLLITKTIEGDVTEEELKKGSLTFEVTKDGTPVEGSPFTLENFEEIIPGKYYTLRLEASLGTYHVVEKLKTPEGYTVSTSYTVTGTGEDGTETSDSSENREAGIDAVFAADRSSGVKVDITNSYTEIKEAEAEAEAEESTDIVVEQKGDLLITKTIEGEVTAEELAGALVFTVTNESGSIAGTYTLEDFERTEDGRYEKTLTLVPGGYTVTESMYSVDGFVGSVTYNVGEEEEEGKEPGVTEVLGGETAEAQIRDDYTEIPEDYGKLLIEKSIEGPVTDEDVAGALVFNITRNETGESKSYTLKDFVKTGDSRYTLELAAIAGGYTVRETEYGVDGYSCTVSYQAGAVDVDGVETDALAEDTGANVTVTAGGTGTVLIQNAYTAQAVMSSNDNKTQDKNTKAQAKTTKKVTKSAKTETATASASDTVSTGDATPIRLLVTVMLVCAAGIAAVLIYRKKRLVPARYKGKWEKNSR